MDNRLYKIGTIIITSLIIGLYITNESSISNSNIDKDVLDQENMINKTTNIYDKTQISIESIEVNENTVIVYVSIVGSWDHWRIILNDDFPIGAANSIKGQGVSNQNKYTFDSVPPGTHTVRVAAVDPAHRLIGQIINQTFTINEPTEGRTILINNQKFLIYKTFNVEELTENDFIGLYESLPPDQVILFIFKSSTLHEYFNDHVPIGTDVIWLNEKYEIVHLESVEYCENADKMNYIERLEKCHISRSEGKYLIETHTGFIKENNIELGLKTKIHLFKN
mgnify:FL=1